MTDIVWINIPSKRSRSKERERKRNARLRRSVADKANDLEMVREAFHSKNQRNLGISPKWR